MMDVLRLKEELAKSRLSQQALSEKLGMSTTLLNDKINGKREFKAKEIEKLVQILGDEAVTAIFFSAL